MQATFCRRTAMALMVLTFAFVSAGCDRRTTDPSLPSTTSPGTTTPASPSTSPSDGSPGTLPDGAASAASR